MYCEFHDNFGYTYVSRNAGVEINIDDLLTSNKHIKVRHVLRNGTQIETVLKNIELYKDRSIRNLLIQIVRHYYYVYFHSLFLYLWLIIFSMILNKFYFYGNKPNFYLMQFVIFCNWNLNAWLLSTDRSNICFLVQHMLALHQHIVFMHEMRVRWTWQQIVDRSPPSP